MKRTPETGDVVRIGKAKKDQLVIFVDDWRCDRLSPKYVFVTIPYNVGETIDPKEKNYVISYAGFVGDGETKVDLNDIEFICKVKFKEKITRTFTVKE